MNLPDVVVALLRAQADFDSEAYAQCFAGNAKVSDEGETHGGLAAIKQWNEKTNASYKVRLEPIEYVPAPAGGILTTKVSGVFPGSPIVLKYHFEIEDDKIVRLSIGG